MDKDILVMGHSEDNWNSVSNALGQWEVENSWGSIIVHDGLGFWNVAG